MRFQRPRKSPRQARCLGRSCELGESWTSLIDKDVPTPPDFNVLWSCYSPYFGKWKYCTISINSSATVTRDAPDENMVSSGSRDERDNYKISSGSRFFFLKLVDGHFFYFLFFLLSKKDFVTLPKWPWPSWHFVDFWGPVTRDWRIEWISTVC